MPMTAFLLLAYLLQSRAWGRRALLEGRRVDERFEA